MSAPSSMTLTDAPEASPRYAGWRVVCACFIVATFCWGFGLYGHGVYLVEFQRLNGWPASLIAGAASAYYLLSATLVIFISDAMARVGPRRVMLAGAACFGFAVLLLGFVNEPWQLYVVYLLLAAGAASLHTGAITTVVGLWFDQRRGLAISLALNGASFGGIVITPVLVIAIEHVGFRTAMAGAAVVMALVMVPVIAAWIDRPPHGGAPPAASTSKTKASWTRHMALRSGPFWSVAAPLAIALMAQIGFIVHQIAFLEPAMGRTYAALAVAVMTVMAIAGRIVLGVFIGRLDVRQVTALSVLSQAVALFAMTQTTDVAALFVACAAFGLSVGNMITLPGLIIQREFDAAAFGMLVGLSTAIGQFTCVVGPGLLGVVRDWSGGYGAAIGLCIVLELVAAALVLMRPGARMPRAQTDQQAPVDFK